MDNQETSTISSKANGKETENSSFHPGNPKEAESASFLTEDEAWTSPEIERALLHAWDTMDLAMIPFLLVGDIAYQAVYGKPFTARKIVFVVSAGYNTKQAKTILRIVEPQIEETTDGMRILWKPDVGPRIPVTIKFLTKHYAYLSDPAHIMIGMEAFPIPNPFYRYWEGDHLDL